MIVFHYGILMTTLDMDSIINSMMVLKAEICAKMSSHALKFAKFKHLDEYNDECELIVRPELVNEIDQSLEEILQMKEKMPSILNKVIKEYFLRVKLEKEISALDQQQSSISYRISKLKQKLHSRKNEKQDIDAKKELRLNVLNFYEENLSLRIQPATGISVTEEEYAVSFVFHNIDENNPQKTYSFTLLTDGCIYKVANCQPPVNEISDLLSILNETDDLQSFIINIRKSFMNTTISM